MKLNDEEKKVVHDLGVAFFRLSETARREGILALEEKLDDLDVESKYGAFARELLNLVVDGIDTKTVVKIARTLADSSDLSEGERTLFEMITTLVVSIQIGDNPRILAKKAAAYLGIEGYFDLCKELVDD